MMASMMRWPPRWNLQDVEVLEPAGEDAGGVYGIGRIGELEPAQPLTEWLPKVRESLAANGLRYYDAGTAVHRVAVGGGACGSYLELAARKGCDTFVTADVKYDAFWMQRRSGSIWWMQIIFARKT